jgi:hypothetical protein
MKPNASAISTFWLDIDQALAAAADLPPMVARVAVAALLDGYVGRAPLIEIDIANNPLHREKLARVLKIAGLMPSPEVEA